MIIKAFKKCTKDLDKDKRPRHWAYFQNGIHYLDKYSVGLMKKIAFYITYI